MYKITWRPSPNMWVGRKYGPINAVVHHRMVGTLIGTNSWFANPDSQVSAHFGIGYVNGKVEISQYVDLADTAWHAGRYDPSGGWTLVKKDAAGNALNCNYYTVGIEHEDGGLANKGIISVETKEASKWLVELLLTGDPALYKKFGIRCKDNGIAAEIGNIQPNTETLIDHNKVSGTRKPYCLRAWLSDPGYVPEWQLSVIERCKAESLAIDIWAIAQKDMDFLKAEIAHLNSDKAALNQQIIDLQSSITVLNEHIYNLEKAQVSNDLSATRILEEVSLINTSLNVIKSEADAIQGR